MLILSLKKMCDFWFAKITFTLLWYLSKLKIQLGHKPKSK